MARRLSSGNVFVSLRQSFSLSFFLPFFLSFSLFFFFSSVPTLNLSREGIWERMKFCLVISAILHTRLTRYVYFQLVALDKLGTNCNKIHGRGVSRC